MNTKGANLLLSTLLIATCSAAPAFAEDKTTALPAGAPDVSKEPKEPSAADAKNVGKVKRGIIIKSLAPTTKPADSGKATTAENKGVKTGRVKNVVNEGSHVFGGGRGLFDPVPSKPTVKIQTKTTTTTTVKHSTTPTVIQKSKNTPLQVKTKPAPVQPVAKNVPAKNLPSKGNEPIASKHTGSSTKTVVINAGEQIVTAWLNKKGDKPHFKDGERLQVNVAANKDCNLMIFNYDGEQLTQLYPNEYQNNPFVKAGQTIEVGGEGCKFDFTAANSSNKASNEKIFVYAYPLESDSAPISIAMARVPDSPFRAAEMTPERYRELVNKSEVFFSRKVNVTHRKNSEPEEVQLASFEQPSHPTAAPNKIELHLVIDPNKK